MNHDDEHSGGFPGADYDSWKTDSGRENEHDEAPGPTISPKEREWLTLNSQADQHAAVMGRSDGTQACNACGTTIPRGEAAHGFTTRKNLQKFLCDQCDKDSTRRGR